MAAYLLVVIEVIVILLALGIIAYLAKWHSITERPLAFLAPVGFGTGSVDNRSNQVPV